LVNSATGSGNVNAFCVVAAGVITPFIAYGAGPTVGNRGGAAFDTADAAGLAVVAGAVTVTPLGKNPDKAACSCGLV
jgi:hypothetical protein